MVKTLAPRGQPPTSALLPPGQNLRHLGSVGPKRQSPGLFYQLYFHDIGQEEVYVCLRDLLRHLRGHVIAILDNSSTHHGEPLVRLQRRHSRLYVGYFPSDAPELNFDEGVWSLAKTGFGQWLST